MKTIKFLFISFAFAFSAFTYSGNPSAVEITCPDKKCGCDAAFGKIAGVYQATGTEENGYPVFMGPDKELSYMIKLHKETPQGANFQVYRWEIRATTGELIYFNKNIQAVPFPFADVKDEWIADNSGFDPVPTKIVAREK